MEELTVATRLERGKVYMIRGRQWTCLKYWPRKYPSGKSVLLTTGRVRCVECRKEIEFTEGKVKLVLQDDKLPRLCTECEVKQAGKRKRDR